MLKCLVLDLDNTIWGGVVGEDGVDGIRLTPEYLAVQQAALDLKTRGILLAVCSKNNPADIQPAFRRQEMILRDKDISVWRISWADKASNLREISGVLNIGLDAIAFADDSPVERGLVRASLPEVTVIELPPDPAGYAAAIRATFADRPVTAEDRQRTSYYAQQKQRMEAEQQAASREKFLASLGIELEIGQATEETIPRIAQLSQRTNQFTLTGRTYEPAQLQEWCKGNFQRIYWGRLRDRIGDYGIVAAAFVQYEVDKARLVGFYLSCRAMGRGVESAFLSVLMAEYGPLHIAAIPTGRNEPAIEFFAGGLYVAPSWVKIIRQHDLIFARVHALACDVFQLPPETLAVGSSPENTVQWDSLGAMTLMLAIEEEYDIVFTPEEMEISPNLGQIAEMVREKIGRSSLCAK